MKIALIGCGNKKNDKPCKAREMYTGFLFRKRLEFCELFANKTYILSARYGLLNLDDEIIPYNLRLDKIKKAYRESWSRIILRQIDNIVKPNDIIFIFAGKVYYKDWQNEMSNRIYNPLSSKGIIAQKAILKMMIEDCKNGIQITNFDKYLRHPKKEK